VSTSIVLPLALQSSSRSGSRRSHQGRVCSRGKSFKKFWREEVNEPARLYLRAGLGARKLNERLDVFALLRAGALTKGAISNCFALCDQISERKASFSASARLSGSTPCN
jgi:hypothetical protein